MTFPTEHDRKLFPTFLAAGGYLATWSALLLDAPPWVCAAFGLDAAIGGAGSTVVHARRKEAAPALVEGFVAVSAGTVTAAAFVPSKAMPDPRIAVTLWLAGYGAALLTWMYEETGGRPVRGVVSAVLRRLSGVPSALAAGASSKRRRGGSRRSRVAFSSEIPDWLTTSGKNRSKR